jgi:hypothetical protein
MLKFGHSKQILFGKKREGAGEEMVTFEANLKLLENEKMTSKLPHKSPKNSSREYFNSPSNALF